MFTCPNGFPPCARQDFTGEESKDQGAPDGDEDMIMETEEVPFRSSRTTLTSTVRSSTC